MRRCIDGAGAIVQVHFQFVVAILRARDNDVVVLVVIDVSN